MMHTLRESSCKVERKKGQQYSNEFRRNAVEQMRGCSNIVRLARFGPVSVLPTIHPESLQTWFLDYNHAHAWP
jgi:hypothetical protein